MPNLEWGSTAYWLIYATAGDVQSSRSRIALVNVLTGTLIATENRGLMTLDEMQMIGVAANASGYEIERPVSQALRPPTAAGEIPPEIVDRNDDL